MSGAGTGTPVVPSSDATLADLIDAVQTRLGDPTGTTYGDDLVRLHLNAGLQYIYPNFYAVETTYLEADGTTKVFALEPTVGSEVSAIIDAWELQGTYDWSTVTDDPLNYIGDSERLSPMRDYRVARGSLGAAFLNFFTAPSSDVVLTMAERPAYFADDGAVLSDLGLPERTKDALVYYACWQLLSQRLTLNQETLITTARQVEDDNTVETTTQGGTETQTQTDDKSEVQTGARDTTETENRTGTQAEVIDLEQTEAKDGTLTTTGAEVTTDVRTAATTGTSGETEDSTRNTLREMTEWSDDTTVKTETVEDDGTVTSAHGAKHTDDDVTDTTSQDVTTTETRDLETGAEWSNTTPATQTGGTETGTVITNVNQQAKQGTVKRDIQEGASTDTETRDLDKTTIGVDDIDTHHEVTDWTRETLSGAKTGTKAENTSEDSQGTVTTEKSEGNLENNLTVSSQEKTTTDNLQKTTVTDEDSSLTTLNTGTQVTALERDTTQQMTRAGGKTTTMETMNTFRDRLQTVQYYKLLLDMELQTKKMRPWTSRGL